VKLYIHNIAELVSLLVAVIFYARIKGSFMKWVLPFLAFIFLAECIAMYLLVNKLVINNTTLYYIVSIVEMIFYTHVFYHFTTKEGLFRRSIIIFRVLSTLGFVIGLIFFTKDLDYYFSCFIVSSFFFVFISLRYIYGQYSGDEKINLLSESGFWLALGVSVFFSGTCIVFCLHDLIMNNNLNIFGTRLYHMIPRILSIILYSSISIAIILFKRKNAVSLSIEPGK
jgi:hypothetical protein